jgi:hypothetical protein
MDRRGVDLKVVSEAHGIVSGIVNGLGCRARFKRNAQGLVVKPCEGINDCDF